MGGDYHVPAIGPGQARRLALAAVVRPQVVVQVRAVPGREQVTPAMLTRPPPVPRTRTMGRVLRGAQVRPFGGLSPWPASSSKQT